MINWGPRWLAGLGGCSKRRLAILLLTRAPRKGLNSASTNHVYNWQISPPLFVKGDDKFLQDDLVSVSIYVHYRFVLMVINIKLVYLFCVYFKNFVPQSHLCPVQSLIYSLLLQNWLYHKVTVHLVCLAHVRKVLNDFDENLWYLLATWHLAMVNQFILPEPQMVLFWFCRLKIVLFPRVFFKQQQPLLSHEVKFVLGQFDSGYHLLLYFDEWLFFLQTVLNQRACRDVCISRRISDDWGWQRLIYDILIILILHWVVCEQIYAWLAIVRKEVSVCCWGLVVCEDVVHGFSS